MVPENLLDKNFETIRTVKMANGVSVPFVTTKIDMTLPPFAEKVFANPREIVEYFGHHMVELSNEYSLLICFDAGMYPICATVLGIGDQVNGSIPVRSVIQMGILSNATYLVIMHNHPTAYEKFDNVKPSKDDIKLMDAIQKSCKMMSMLLYDSIIIGGNRKNGEFIPSYYSMREKKLRRLNRAKYEKYESKFSFLGLSEDALEWGRYGETDSNKYWGFDVKQRPIRTITAYNNEELMEAINRVKSPDIEKETIEKEKETDT